MNETFSFVLLLAGAPVGMAVCYWRGKVRQERRLAQSFADEVEFYMIVRKQGG